MRGRPASPRADRPGRGHGPAAWTGRARRVVAAILTAAAIAGALWAVPAYSRRLFAAMDQTRTLHARFDATLDDMEALHWPVEYPKVLLIRERTFEDAVLVIPDDPADGKLASIPWMQYFLYPRRVFHLDALEALPDVEPDFLLVTPNFPDFIPAEQRGRQLSLRVESPRAAAYAAEHWETAP